MARSLACTLALLTTSAGCGDDATGPADASTTEIETSTGITTEAYCIIEQGKVDALLQSSPKDRRVIFEEAAGKHPDLAFGKVDTEAEQQLSAAAGIRSIPNLMVFKDGILVFNQAGALPAHALEDLIGQVRELDMDEVRRQIAEQTPAS